MVVDHLVAGAAGTRRRMMIYIVGDFCANLDEGYKNTSHYLANHLESRHAVVRINHKQVNRLSSWRGLGRPGPDVIHTVAQPTDQSLLFTHLLRKRWPRATTVVSALRADRYFPGGEVSTRQRLLLRLARPDLTLVQNERDGALFRELGCATRYLPNGVDLDRFKPVPAEEKRLLRAKYGLAPDRPVVLHVGHLQPNRNLLSLRRLPEAGIQVLVAGSLYMGVQSNLIEQLEAIGFHVLKGWQPQVEELYMLSDLYVFPLRPGDSLSMPLSVLEAMACNLPILTTRFTGLLHAFNEEHGFHFLDHRDDLLQAVRDALQSRSSPATREMVQGYSWSAIVDRLEAYYEGAMRC